MTFDINSNSYANHIIAGTYAINSKDIYEGFTDAEGKAHRRLKRTKVSGSVDMMFETMEEFNSFLAVLNNSKDLNLAIPMTVTVNNLNQDKSINAFLDFEPVRDRKANWNDYIMRYSLKIEER